MEVLAEVVPILSAILVVLLLCYAAMNVEFPWFYHAEAKKEYYAKKEKPTSSYLQVLFEGETEWINYYHFYGYSSTTAFYLDKGDKIRIEDTVLLLTVKEDGHYFIHIDSPTDIRVTLDTISSMETVFPKQPKFIKATGLARIMYPDAEEKDGYLEVFL